MPRVPLQYKIGFLLIIAVAAVISIGYLSYKSLSSIVASIHVKAKPDYTVLTLKEIALELEKSENDIRLYTFRNDYRTPKPNTQVIASIDAKMNDLRESNKDNAELLARIDTISWLIKEKYVLWNRMLKLHETDSTYGKLESLSNELLKIDTLSKSQQEESFMERLLRTSPLEPIADHKELAKKITTVEVQDLKRKKQLSNEQLKLSRTSQKLTSRFYTLLLELENAEKKTIEEKAQKANMLAQQTYRWLGYFMIGVTLLALIVVFLVARYTKKTYATQRMLEHSKQEAERLAKIKEVFTANVSHEIRTPLNAIYGFLEQIEPETLEEENREKVNVIKTASENLLRIVNDVLDFSKLQSGKLMLENRHYSLYNLIDEVYQLFHESAAKNSSTLQVQIDSDVTDVLLGDSYRLKQVLTNLVGNAIKFTRNGTITIQVKEEYRTRKKAHLIINIIDTGIGIAEDKLSSIFEDYTQGEADTTMKYGGTGLGLSIVKKIIDMIGGTIKVESRLNAGSTFTCSFEQEIGDPEMIQKPEPKTYILPPQELQNYRILIADDETFNRMLIKTILKKWKMPFEEAIDGLDAIDKIKSGRFQIALLDIRMPGIDGVKAARFIRDILKKSSDEFPLIALTAAFSTEECIIYRENGFNEVIRKPFNQYELLNAIISLLKLPVITQLEVEPQKTIEKTEGTLNLKELYLISNNDETFVREMLDTFVQSYQQGLKMIDEKLQSGEYNEIAEIAHKICSPCRHLGADELWRLTKKLEKDCRNYSQTNNINQLLFELNNEFKCVEKQISNMFVLS